MVFCGCDFSLLSVGPGAHASALHLVIQSSQQCRHTPMCPFALWPRAGAMAIGFGPCSLGTLVALPPCTHKVALQ